MESRAVNNEKALSSECQIIKFQSSRPIENQNRKTHIVLGTHKVPMKTEASTNFKNFESRPNQSFESSRHISIESSGKKPESKGLSFGSFSTDYKTTASSSYATHKADGVQKLVSTPANNIFFGDYIVPMTSTGHSEFCPKTVEKLSKDEMGKIKDNHRNSHFVVGSYESGYMTTNKQYAGEQTEQIKFIPDTKSHVVFGSYKGKEVKKGTDSRSKSIGRNNKERVGDRKKAILV